jgi:hypothetical protein
MEREFLDYETDWTTYYAAMRAAERYESTRAFKMLKDAGWRIDAFRYRTGWALYRVRNLYVVR